MKLIPLAALIALAACAAPDPAYQAALANIPPAARARCTYDAQMAAANENSRHDALGLIAAARYNRTERQCLEMMAAQYPATEPVVDQQQALANAKAQIARYGKEPVKACYVAARENPTLVGDMAKLEYANACVGRLRPI
jgi:hypothetical protein